MRNRPALKAFRVLCVCSVLCAVTACGGTTPAAQHASSTEPGASDADLSLIDALPGFHQPRANLWSGGVPSADQLEAFAAQGGQVVISLLTDVETESQQVTALGMTFISIPISGAADLTEANARKLGDAFTAHPHTPTLLHCASGNRAGALLALEAYFVEGMTATDALTLGTSAGLSSLEPNVREVLDAAPNAAPHLH